MLEYFFCVVKLHNNILQTDLKTVTLRYNNNYVIKLINTYFMKSIIQKIGIVICLILFHSIVNGQIKSAVVSINGLTCSQCSKSVEMQLKKIAFIESINMDLKTTTASITFKKNNTIDMFKVAKAVENAGFSVEKVMASIQPDGIKKISDYCINVGNVSFQSNKKVPSLNKKVINIQYLGKAFGTPNPKIDNNHSCQRKSQYFITFL